VVKKGIILWNVTLCSLMEFQHRGQKTLILNFSLYLIIHQALKAYRGQEV
jgi:hypothetical protein